MQGHHRSLSTPSMLVLVGFFLLSAIASVSVSVPGFAQFVDPALRWQTLETPHFRIHFHEGTEGMARLTAVAAEEAYAWWAEKLGYAPTEKVEVVILDRQDGPNGFANLVPNPQFVNFTAYAGFAGGFANSESRSWEELVTFHEYGHIADLDYVRGLSLTLRKIFGRILTPGAQEPTLLVEGIPTYGEFLLRGASRANEPRVAMMLRAMLLENNFPDYQKASFYYSRAEWPPVGSISHDVGPWFLRFLEEAYGQDTYARLKAEMVTDPWWALGGLAGMLVGIPFVSVSGDFNAIFERVTGKRMPELWREFRAWLSQQFAQQIEEIEREGVTLSRQLTRFGYSTGGARWSPDGEWIYYTHSDPERAVGLRRVRPDGTGDEVVASGPIGGFALSPDGSFVVYAKRDTYKKFYSRRDLYKLDLQTGRETRLTWGERPFSLAITPDGQSVIYARYRWGEKTPRISKIDLATGQITVVKEFPEDWVVEGIALSPDGKTLALSIWRRGGYQDIYTMPADGSGSPTPLTQDKATDHQPTWSPDGQYVLFSSDRTGVYNLYAYRVLDGKLFRVTNVLTGAFGPSVSPQGDRLAFTGYSSRGYDLHLMDYEPQSWKEVPYEREAVPAWEGFPEVDYEVRPYTPLPSLRPKLWYPTYDGKRFGAATFGRDALFQHSYNLAAGYDLQAKSPYLDFRYSYSGMLPTLSLSGRWSLKGYSLGANASYPVIARNTLRQTLSVGYRLSHYGQPSQTFSGTARLRHSRAYDMTRMSLDLGLTGLYTLTEGGALRKAIASLQKSVMLPLEGPHALRARLSAGWSDAPSPERGFRVGGIEGSFALRGLPRGALAGITAWAGSVEYRFPLFRIERGLSLWPLFLDDLDGTIFVDFGRAGDDLFSTDFNDVRTSFGLEVRLSTNFLSYFGGPTLRVGVAQALGEPQPVVYFRVDAF